MDDLAFPAPRLGMQICHTIKLWATEGPAKNAENLPVSPWAGANGNGRCRDRDVASNHELKSRYRACSDQPDARKDSQDSSVEFHDEFGD